MKKLFSFLAIITIYIGINEAQAQWKCEGYAKGSASASGASANISRSTDGRNSNTTASTGINAGGISKSIDSKGDECNGINGGIGAGLFIEGSIQRCSTPKGNSYTKISAGAGKGVGIKGVASVSATGGIVCDNKGDKE